ncbi:hypothetical protein L1987_52450 [Smallanthus sonchifolius]|uniref:Uncharacterized protein n=1 Tax=Smallanthus sonchifolius TaxID=185202 RepID=A0ACB9EUC7_9ASTR|nr:hypothetical protein L1987_52450 [Smallanthus sonchifolius]
MESEPRRQLQTIWFSSFLVELGFPALVTGERKGKERKGNMEMEIVAAESIGVGEDLTPPLSPIAYSLHDSFLPSHCANCFSPLPHPPPTSHHHHHHHHHHVLYCSPSCSSSHSPLHISSGAHLLSPDSSTVQTSDLRVALLLLLQIKPFKSYDRICGFMSNRNNLLTSTNHDDLSTRIKNGARAMAIALASMTDEGFLLEEAVLCAVLTNAVEVQDRTGRSVGIAVYDTSFSWINHSCSPNACYRFLTPETLTGDQRCLITPASSQPIDFSDLLTGSAAGGPRIVVRSIKMIQKGEQVTIAYTDLLQPKELRRSELWSKYRFTCCCHRCVAFPLTYVDQRLQESCGSNDLLTEYIDDAVHDYLSYNDAESCCKKLENALLNHEIRLHPQNYLALNTYTALASAYSSASSNAVEDGNGLKMKRFGAAYALLLALLTHDLFLYESSLIVSVSNYWIGAGESLVNLAKCIGDPVSRCGCGCDVLEEANYEEYKEQIFKCMSGIIKGGKVWKFLIVGNGYLEEVVKDLPLRWFEVLRVGDDSDGLEVFGLGAHCLLYGGILSKISGGHLSCYVRV